MAQDMPPKGGYEPVQYKVRRSSAPSAEGHPVVGRNVVAVREISSYGNECNDRDKEAPGEKAIGGKRGVVAVNERLLTGLINSVTCPRKVSAPVSSSSAPVRSWDSDGTSSSTASAKPSTH